MSLSDDDFLARVYAMSGSSDDDDTRRVRDVRTAFRSMQDEEPPERGLAELMAAARVKADTMKPVPWWRMLLRPPVLALASVMVLVGGAVLIGRHGDSMKAEAPTASSSTGKQDPSDIALDKGATLNGSGPTKTLAIAKQEAHDEKESGSDTAPPTAPTGAAGAAGAAGASGQGSATNVPVQRPADHAPRANASAPPRPIEQGARTREPVPDDRPAEPPGHVQPAPPPAPPRVEPTRPATEVSPGAATDSHDDHDGEDKLEAKKDDAKAPETQSTVTRGGSSGSRQPTIDQLVRQCQAAATRGDCPAAKSIAARIAKDNAEAYRSRVVKDAAIARCLK